MRSYERPPSIRRLGIALAIGCGVVVAALSLAGPGAGVIGVCYRFLEFYSGVFSLVALSLTVMGGLAATDRLLLQVRHRVLLQAVHRATAFAAVGFLCCHALTKLAEGHAGLIDLLVPFAASHHTVLIGLGTLAGHGLVLAACTGIVRGRFAAVPKVWVWRAVHSAAYLAWPAAMIHGLTAGRRPATWVVVSYAACALLVLLSLFVRVIVNWKGGAGAPRAQPAAARRSSTWTAAQWSGAQSVAGRPGAQSVAGRPGAQSVAGRPGAQSVAGRPGAQVATAWQPVRAKHAADSVREIAASHQDSGVHEIAASYQDSGYGTAFYENPWERDLDGAAEFSGNGVFEAVSYEVDEDTPTRPFESVSDDEFWAYLRGGEPR